VRARDTSLRLLHLTYNADCHHFTALYIYSCRITHGPRLGEMDRERWKGCDHLVGQGGRWSDHQRRTCNWT